MQDKLDKYEILKTIGKSLFSAATKDVDTAKKFFSKAIAATNPEVLSLYFEHVMIAPELGKRLAEKAGADSGEIEFLLWLHEIGRLADPAEYLRNDLIEENLLKDFNLSSSLIKELPPIETMLKVVKMMELKEDQIEGRESLNPEQEKLAASYFDSLTPNQRIIFFADNFGKKNKDGDLFDFEIFIDYLRTYSKQYPGSEFSSQLRCGVVLTINIIEKTIEWFESLKIDYQQILDELKNYGPKFLIIVRHGKLTNPANKAYNRDEVTDKKDIIHISEDGKKQMFRLGELIIKRKFRVKKIYVSPETRTIESKDALNEALKIEESIETKKDLDEIYAPGPYLEKMTLNELQKLKGATTYDESRWVKYNHEKPEQVIERMNRVFWEMVSNLNVADTGLLISHGDPIAWFINSFVTGKIPDAKELRDLIYPNKGDAIVAIIDPQGNFFSYYLLEDPTLIEGESY